MVAKYKRSNNAHRTLYKKAIRQNCVPLARYHGEVIKRQNRKKRILSRKQRRQLKKRIAPRC